MGKNKPGPKLQNKKKQRAPLSYIEKCKKGGANKKRKENNHEKKRKRASVQMN